MITSSCASNENIRLNLEKLTWADVREELYKVNPELTKKCDHINKFNKYPVYKLKYAYGLSIIHEGEFYLPTLDGKTISINDTRVPESLKQSLAYSSLPLACIINNSCEVLSKKNKE